MYLSYFLQVLMCPLHAFSCFRMDKMLFTWLQRVAMSALSNTLHRSWGLCSTTQPTKGRPCSTLQLRQAMWKWCRLPSMTTSWIPLPVTGWVCVRQAVPLSVCGWQLHMVCVLSCVIGCPAAVNHSWVDHIACVRSFRSTSHPYPFSYIWSPAHHWFAYDRQSYDTP